METLSQERTSLEVYPGARPANNTFLPTPEPPPGADRDPARHHRGGDRQRARHALPARRASRAGLTLRPGAHRGGRRRRPGARGREVLGHRVRPAASAPDDRLRGRPRAPRGAAARARDGAPLVDRGGGQPERAQRACTGGVCEQECAAHHRHVEETGERHQGTRRGRWQRHNRPVDQKQEGERGNPECREDRRGACAEASPGIGQRYAHDRHHPRRGKTRQPARHGIRTGRYARAYATLMPGSPRWRPARADSSGLVPARPAA